MADVTKSSFNEANRHTMVIFQRGKDVLDFELNEFQDILRTQQYRALVAESGGLNPGSNDDGYLVVGEGEDNEVTIKAGALFCDGIPLVLSEDFTYAEFSTNGGGSPVINTVYLTVSEQEVPDPSQVAILGETTRRMKLIVEVNHVVGTTLPADSPQPIWQAGTRHFRLAEITRAPGVAAIVADDVEDKRFRLPAFTVAKYVGQYALTPDIIATDEDNYSPPGISDAFVVRLNASAPVNITGMRADVQYRKKTLINLGSNDITFTEEDTDSVAANRFSKELVLYPGGAVDVTYDDVLDRWRFIEPGTAAALPDETLITPPSLTGGGSSIADYNPVGWSSSTVVRLTATSEPNISGFSAAVTMRGRRKLLVNFGASDITIQSHGGFGASLDANRVIIPHATFAYRLIPGAGVYIQYDIVSERWRLVETGLPNIATNWTKPQTFHRGITVATDADFPDSPSVTAESVHSKLFLPIGEDVQYSAGTTLPTYTTRVDLLDLGGCHGWGPLGALPTGGITKREPGQQIYERSFRLPRKAILHRVRSYVAGGNTGGTPTTGTVTLFLVTPKTLVSTPIGVGTNIAAGTFVTTDNDSIGHEIDSENELIVYRFVPGTADSGDSVYWLEVTWDDPGARSILG